MPPGTDTNDFVLQRAYRNQREILVLAHAIGFGVYGRVVQMLENSKHWEDVGYDIVSGDFSNGSLNIVERTLSNSPSRLNTPQDIGLISVKSAESLLDEVQNAATEIKKFIDGGIYPHEILVVSIDDRAARSYFSRLSKELLNYEISSNNIIIDPYSEPPFRIDGKVTMSTVYRAKGNEAAVVIILGADASVLETRTGRNKLFVAFTRTKGWLRIFGVGGQTFDKLAAEIRRANQKSPRIEFRMPDMTSLNTIQRGLEDKHARIIEAKRRMARMKTELKLSDEDMAHLVEED